MAITEVYVDPSIAANSGSGTIGDPYGDLQYALNSVTRDATNGDRFNVKAGTDEVLTASLSFATYGTPSSGAPCVFQGYTSAQGDGGIGGISGAATYSIINTTTLDYIIFIDMHLHNSGAAVVARVDDFCQFINCEVDNSTGNGIQGDIGLTVIGCYIHNIGTYGINNSATGSLIYANYLENGANSFAIGINTSNAVYVIGNIIDIGSGGSEGIRLTGGSGSAINNSIWANGSTGAGIVCVNGIGQHVVLNNVIEGFSGAAAEGILTQTSASMALYGHNKVYNCTTNFSISGVIFVDLGNNDSLSASPFVNASGGDFTLTATAAALYSWPETFTQLALANYMNLGALQIAPASGINFKQYRTRNRELA